MATTYSVPQNLGDILGAHHDGNFETVTAELESADGTWLRGSVLCAGTGPTAGKLVQTAAGNEAAAFGILLDPAVDTEVPFSDGTVTGSVARAGTFRGPALIVNTGVNAATLTDALRKNGIFIEGPITVPAALAAKAKPEREEHRRAEDERDPKTAIEEERRRQK